MFKRYEAQDVIVNAIFDNNFAYNPKDKNGGQIQADHARLDNYVKEEMLETPCCACRSPLTRSRSAGRTNLLPSLSLRSLVTETSFGARAKRNSKERMGGEAAPSSSTQHQHQHQHQQQSPTVAKGDGGGDDIESGPSSTVYEVMSATQQTSPSQESAGSKAVDRPLVLPRGRSGGSGAELAV